MRLQAAREKSGKTQAQAARLAGITEQTYQRYEYGTQEPGVRIAIRIAKVLGTTVEDLFGAATPKNDEQPDGNPAGKS